jgi:hypothetical protein
MATHDAIQNSFASIVRDEKFHVLCEQNTPFLVVISLIITMMTGYYVYSRWYLHFGIVFMVDGICTLTDVIIVDLIHPHLVLQVFFFLGMVATITTQTKVVSYCNRHLKDDFIFLVVEIFKCLH